MILVQLSSGCNRFIITSLLFSDDVGMSFVVIIWMYVTKSLFLVWHYDTVLCTHTLNTYHIHVDLSSLVCVCAVFVLLWCLLAHVTHTLSLKTFIFIHFLFIVHSSYLCYWMQILLFLEPKVFTFSSGKIRFSFNTLNYVIKQRFFFFNSVLFRI
jgi:hypothetical protein